MIAVSIANTLENDFLSQTKDSKYKQIEQKLNNLKIVDKSRGQRLKEAFDSLNKKLINYKDLDIEKSKEDYLDKKYTL